MEIKSGETLTVYKTDSEYWGVYEKSGGKKVTLAEMEYRLLGGLNLNGGNVVFVNQTGEDIYVNCLNVSSSSVVTLQGNGNVCVGNVKVGRNLSLNREGEEWLKIVGDLVVSNGQLTLGAGRIEVGGDLTVYGSGLSMNDAAGYILVNGDVNISGTSYGGYSNFEKGTLELRGNLSKEDNGERGWYVRTA